MQSLVTRRAARAFAPALAPSALRTLGARWYAAAGEQQDVVVIGGGPGGYVAAIKGAQLGLKVTCVEGRGTLGGTCLNVGCIPSKALLHASHLFHDANHTMAKHGISVGCAIRPATPNPRPASRPNPPRVAFELSTARIFPPLVCQRETERRAEENLRAEAIAVAASTDPSSRPLVRLSPRRPSLNFPSPSACPLPCRSEVSIDVGKMMEQKSKSVTGLTKGIEGLFKKNKVSYVKGWGALTANPGEVVVSKEDGSTETISAKNVILATGSEPATLPGVDVDEETVVTSTGALSLKSVPERMVVIGGGVIGLELGSVWSRLGAKVTVVEFGKDICPPMDAQMRKTFQRALKKQGFDFKMEKKVTAAEKTASGVKLTVEPSAGGDAEFLETDVVLVATGRKPYTTGLGLDAAGVEVNPRGQVMVDMHTYATNKPGVYAIGDIVEGPMLAHKAEEEGISCVEQLAGKAGHVNYDVIPSIIYTHPEVAWCGKTEEEVKASGVEYNVGTFPFAANSRARTNDDSEGLVKFVSCAKTDKILGAHIVGPNAGELLGECVLAMEYGAATEDIARTCHGHPTLSEAVKEAALATGGKPIHF